MVELAYVVFRSIWTISRLAVKVAWYAVVSLVLGVALLTEVVVYNIRERR